MRKMRPVLSWILIMTMLITNVDYVRATTTPESEKQVIIKDVSENSVIREDVSNNDVSNNDVSADESSSSDVSGNDTEEIEDISANESKISSDTSILYSGSESGVNWQITSDGVLTISGEQETGTEPIKTAWLDYESVIKSAMVTAKSITSTRGWFYSCSNLTTIDVSSFDTSEVNDMSYMFAGCNNITALDLSNFNTSNVTDMSGMFYDCTSLTSLDLSNFNTSNVTDMNRMFLTSYVEDYNHTSNLTTLNISSFDTSNVTNLCAMFAGCNSLTSLDLSHFNTSKVTNMSGMFWYCEGLTSLDISNFNTTNVTYMDYMFSSCNNLTSLNVLNFNTSNVVDMENMFYACNNLVTLNLSSFDTSKVTDMSWMFACDNIYDGNFNHKLTTVNISSFNTSNVTNMEGMFAGCDAFTSLNLSNFNTANVTTMADMFYGCARLISLNVSSFDTSNVTNMSGMFSCGNLSSLDITNFNTSNVTDMSFMFAYSNLSSIDLSNFDTSNVTDMWGMFAVCQELTSLDLSNFDTSNVTNMYCMFSKCSSLSYLDLSSFNTSNVHEINMNGLFDNCSSLSIIKTIPNLQLNVELPVSPMYDQQKSEYTKLPLGLSESIYLYADKSLIPEFVPTIENSSNIYLTVLDEKMKTPISDVKVAIENRIYTTDKYGSIPFTGNKTNYPSVTFSKRGYTTKKISLNLSSTGNVVYLTPEYNFNIKPPKVSANVKLKNSVKVAGVNINWLDLNYKLDIGTPSGSRKGIEQTLPFEIEQDLEKNTIKVIFGIKQSDDDGDVNAVSYKKMKNICDSVGKKGASKKIQKFMKQHGKINSDECGVKIDTAIMGYFEYDLSNKQILECGAFIAMEGEGSLTWRPTIGGGLVYVKGTLTLSAEGRLILNFAEDNLNFRAEIEFGEALRVGAGIGVSDFHGEIGVEGKLTETVRIPFKSAKESLDIKLSGLFYGEVKFAMFTFPAEIDLGEVYIFPLGKNSTKSTSSQNLASFDISKATVLPRNYNFLSATPMQETTTFENVYPNGEAKMCELEDGTLLAVWIADLGTKSDTNRTTLVYSVNKGNGWSTAQPICETGRGDFYPSLSVSGNKASVTYMNCDMILPESANLIDYQGHIDIYTSIYENGTFTTPQLVTETGNNIMELNPKIAMNNDQLAVVWVENSKNNPFLLDGVNSIYMSINKNGTWTKQLVAENVTMIPSIDITWKDDKVFLAYTLDVDNDLNTTEDVELYLWTEDETIRCTADSKADSNVQFLGDKLYWASNAEIMQMNIGDVGSTQSTGIRNIYSYQILQNATNRAILFIGTDGFKNELYLSEEENGVFQTPVPVTDYGNHISDYAAVYRDNGEITTLIFEREVLNKDGAIYGATNMHMSDTLAAHNLILEEAWYLMDDMTEDNKLPVNLSLYNASSEAVKSVQVSLEANGKAFYTETLNCNIAANELTELTVNYPVTAAQMGQTITIKAVPVDFADNILTDNTYELVLGCADVALQNFAISNQGENSVLTGKVVNNGYRKASNVAFTILEGGAEGAAIHTVSCGDLAVGAEYDISYTIPSDKLAFDDAFDVKYFHVMTSTDEDEEAYDNNSENLAAFPIKVTGLTIDSETLEMKAGTTKKLGVTVAPENALDKTVYYTSDKHEVAVVLEDGTIVATAKGTATISAITSDGAFIKSCVVTVTDPEASAPAYEMNTRWESLEIGKTKKLSLVDADKAAVPGILWNSSNANVASVDENGLVKAIAVGTAYIICTNADNSYYNACVIQVTSKELQALVFETSSKELTEGETLQMLPAYYPIDTTTDKTLQWTSSDETVATVSSEGLVTAISAGTVTIKATATNGISEQYKISVAALPRYTVTFDTGLGDEPVEMTGILGGSTVTLPTEPTREGYLFKGWFTEKDGKGTQFTASTTVCADTYLYAFWNYIDTPAAPDGLWITKVSPQTYTGKAIKPEVQVYDSNTLLKEKVDYTISFKNNIKANDASVAKTAPTIIVTGKGNYTGKETLTFQILAKNLNSEDIIISELVKAANNKAQKPVPMLTYNGKKLKNKSDFTVTYPDTSVNAYKVPGTYTIKVTGKGNFTGELEIPFVITDDILMSKTKVASVSNQTYNGKPIEPEFVVTYKKEKLVKEKDYKVTYKNNIEVGKATAILTGIGNYAGSKSVTFRIDGVSLSKATVEGMKNKTYNGEEQTQKLIVKLDGITLKENTDYEVTYTKNINAGTAGMIIKGIGKYSGSIKKSFKITGYDLSKDNKKLLKGLPKNLTISYTKNGSTPDLDLTFDGVELVAKKDYTISYSNNKKPAKSTDDKAPTIIIKGKGNFAGTVTVPFTITTKSLANDKNPVTIIVPDIAYSAKTGKYISKPILTDSNGKKLKAGTDYEKEISYTLENGTALNKKTDAPAVGTVIKVTVKGKGNYTDTIESAYKITEASFAKAQIKIKAQAYTGSAITLEPDDITVKVSGTELKYGVDYEIVEDSYKNNLKKGNATVTIKGIGNYGGIKTVKFNITGKKFVWFWNLFQ